MLATTELKLIIRKSGKTQADIAKLMSLDPSTFNRKLNENGLVFTLDEAETLSNILNIPKSKRASIFLG